MTQESEPEPIAKHFKALRRRLAWLNAKLTTRPVSFDVAERKAISWAIDELEALYETKEPDQGRKL